MDNFDDIAADIITSHERHFRPSGDSKIPIWSDEQNMCLLYSTGRIASCGLDKHWWKNGIEQQDEVMHPVCVQHMRLPFRHPGSKITFAVLTYEECLAYRARIERVAQ